MASLHGEDNEDDLEHGEEDACQVDEDVGDAEESPECQSGGCCVLGWPDSSVEARHEAAVVVLHRVEQGADHEGDGVLAPAGRVHLGLVREEVAQGEPLLPRLPAPAIELETKVAGLVSIVTYSRPSFMTSFRVPIARLITMRRP